MLRVLITLIFVFLTFCVLYGISTGTNAAIRGLLKTRQKFSRAFSKPVPSKSLSNPLQFDKHHCTIQQGIVEIKNLFDLHTAGALTREEFDTLKQRLIRSQN